MSQNSRLLKIAQKIAVEVGIDKQLNVEPKQAGLVMVSIIEDIDLVHQVRIALKEEKSNEQIGELVRDILAKQKR
jgi:hypothetical protein